MNRIININLGGLPFTIDEDAYQHLSRYLKSISNYFQGAEGLEEVTEDIEDRFAELLLEKLGKRKIVALADIEEIIKVMGTPEDFGADPIEATVPGSSKPGRRLFRDGENLVIAGVCSGLASYGGMHSPTLIRILFVLLAFIGGLGVVIYAVLWSVLPIATTPSDKLAMRGEPINLENLGKAFKKQKASTRKQLFLPFRIIAFVFKKISSIIAKIYKIMLKIFKPFLILIGIILIIALTIAWLASLFGGFYVYPHLNHFLSNDAFESQVVLTNILLFVGIPIIGLLLVIIRLAFKIRISPNLGLSLFLAWLANLGILAFSVITTAKDFSAGYERTDDFQFGSKENLTFQFLEDNYTHNILFALGPDLVTDGDRIINSFVHIHLNKSNDEHFHCQQRIQSRGGDMEQAQINAEKIGNLIEQEGNQVSFRPYFILGEADKFRAQSVEFDLHIPEGKPFKISGNLWDFSPHGELSLDHIYKTHRFDQALVKREGNHLICINCNNAKAKSYDLSWKEFQQLRIDANVITQIEQGTDYKMTLITDPETKGKLEFNQEDALLSIQQKEGSNLGYAELFIRMPTLSDLEIHTSEWAKIEGFEGPQFSLQSKKGTIRLDNFQLDNFSMELFEKAEVSLQNGEFGRFSFHLRDESKIKCSYHVKFDNVYAELDDESYARILHADTLFYRENHERAQLAGTHYRQIIDLSKLAPENDDAL